MSLPDTTEDQWLFQGYRGHFDQESKRSKRRTKKTNQPWKQNTLISSKTINHEMEEKETRKGVLLLLIVVFGFISVFMIYSYSSHYENSSMSKHRMDSIQQIPMDDVVIPQKTIILPK